MAKERARLQSSKVRAGLYMNKSTVTSQRLKDDVETKARTSEAHFGVEYQPGITNSFSHNHLLSQSNAPRFHYMRSDRDFSDSLRNLETLVDNF